MLEDFLQKQQIDIIRQQEVRRGLSSMTSEALQLRQNHAQRGGDGDPDTRPY